MKLPHWGKLIALTGLVAACTANSQDNTTEENTLALPVTQLITRDTVLLHEYVTDIQAVQNVEVRARVEGFLEKVYVDEGQEVTKGQPLFRISPAEFQAEVIKAKANLKSAIAEAKAAELEIDRVKLLVDKSVITESELKVAQAKLDAAKARIEEAQSAQSNAALRLSYTDIRAPFDGIINRIPLKTGSVVSEGALLTTVSNVSEVYAYFNVSEGEYLEYVRAREDDSVQRETPVTLLLADGAAYAHPGKIETVEVEFDESTGSIAFRARFPNPEKFLKHGATGRVQLANDISNALLVPQKAVVEFQDKNFVFVLDSANTLKMKSFIPHARIPHFYIVQSGLKPGDKVVYEGVQSAKEGMQIRPEFIPMEKMLVQTSVSNQASVTGN